MFAAHAAVALQYATTAAQLQQGTEGRGTVGMAIGVLMARQRISQEEAFQIVVRASQRTNRTLRDIAADVAGGTFDLASPPEEG